MGQRAQSLAQIQHYLDNPDAGTPPPAESILPEEAAPHAAPGVTPPTEKDQIELERAAANRDRAVIARERDQLRLEQERKSALEDKTDQAAARLQQVVNYGKFRLEAAPMPGGLFLPIAVLFLFFLALLPINGQTRLQWLWSVVTGNASLPETESLSPSFGQGQGGNNGNPPFGPTPGPTSGPTSGSGGPTITPQPGPPVTPPGPGPIVPLRSFTGVEQDG